MRTVRLPPACQAVPEAHINTARNRRSFLLTSCSCAWALVHAELPERARAAGPPEQENVPALYDAFAQQYDTLDDGAAASLFGFPTLRQRMLSSANGRVLECGGGTGINLPYYVPAQVQELVMLDVSPGMLSQAQRKPTATPTTFVQGDVQQLPFTDSRFDTVVDTFSFCVYPDPARAAQEMVRVLAPGGQLLLLEHSRSPNTALGWYQDVTNEPVKALGKACAWNQRIVDLIASTGMQISSAEYSSLGTIVSICAKKS